MEVGNKLNPRRSYRKGFALKVDMKRKVLFSHMKVHEKQE